MRLTEGLAAVALLPVAAYGWAFLRYRRAWQRVDSAEQEPQIASFKTPNEPEFSKKALVTVIIAARNEAATLPALLADLRGQTYLDSPTPAFEVIVVDDHSSDATAEVVRGAAAHSSFPLRLLSLAEQAGQPTGKKAAVEAAVAAATTPWVLCTDADCRVPSGWLAAYVPLFSQPEVQLVSGPVLLEGEGLLAALQGLELAALVGTGAASIGSGAPTMCNGANLAYRRTAFREAGGFQGNAHVASGDDEFLLHRIARLYPVGIRFLKTPAATVRTSAQPTLRALLRQRVRWASKWKHYQSRASRWLALLVLSSNLALWLLVLLMLEAPAIWPWVLAAWGAKLGADTAFLLPVLGFFRRRRWLLLVPLLQLLYPPYALAVGVLGLRGGYHWKGRRIS